MTRSCPRCNHDVLAGGEVTKTQARTLGSCKCTCHDAWRLVTERGKRTRKAAA